LETKVEGAGTGIDRLVQSLKTEEYKAIFETVKRGDAIRVYARMESPFKMRVFLLDNPGKENDYECKNFDEEWSCKKTIFITPEETSVNPELLKSIGEYIKNWEMGLEREGLIKVWGSRKKCANHDCICGEVDATKLAQESFSRVFRSEAQIDRYYGYVCMEEKSKIYLEGGLELKMSVATKDAKGYVVVKGGITTTRFEEVEPPLEKFKLPTEGGSSILREFESKYGYIIPIATLVKCWGSNDFGQLGVEGSFEGVGTSSPVKVRGVSNVKQVVTGRGYTCAITENGTAKCWGGTLTLEKVREISGVTSVSIGGSHACALVKDGTVKCWGSNYYGQLGNESVLDSTSPIGVEGLSNVIAISAGDWHTCALLKDGSVKCWGGNEFGQLGDGTKITKGTPVTTSGLSNVIAISAGYDHTCALLKDGTVKCWGNNNDGQLGDGTEIDRSSPVSVVGINNVIAISAGGHHTCALLKDGTVKCWGSNHYGQLGDGTNSDRTLPVPVIGISDAIAISAGYDHTCALLKDGTVKCWGNNNDGQLGDESRICERKDLWMTCWGNKTTPVSANNITNAIDVSAGLGYTCVVVKE